MDHLSKAQIKQIRSLQQKKFRDELGWFVAEGDKCIQELKDYFELVVEANETNTSKTELEQMSSLRTPQGKIAVFQQKHYTNEIPDKNLVLVLDGIQDPGNLGTILRTADWFGVEDVFCSPSTADCYSPKVVQATMGALARVRVHYVDIPQWLSKWKESNPDCPIYGTLLDGQNMYIPGVIHEARNAIIVMGNEGKGITREVQHLLTDKILIPSFGADCVESLNVAIATAIILAEFRRKGNA